MNKPKVELLDAETREPKRRRKRVPSFWPFALILGMAATVIAIGWPGTRDRQTAQPTASESEAQEPETILRIHGSNTLGASLVPMLARKFLENMGAVDIQNVAGEGNVEQRIVGRVPSRSQPLVIEIKAHGSTTAFADLAEGSCDIGAASRQIKREEVEKLSRLGWGLLTSSDCEHVVALDGLAIIVNPANPIDALRVDTIARIFAGEITNWKDVGGQDQPIHLYARDHNSGTFDTFKALVFRKVFELSGWAMRFEDSQELYQAVLEDPDGIGFIGLPYVQKAKTLAVREGESRSFRPTYTTVKSEAYPLSRRLFFYSTQNPRNPHVAEFLALALSDEGQALVKQANLVDLALEPQPASEDWFELAEYQRTIATADFLLTVRFKSGERELDNRADDDIQRFLKMLKRPENRHREIILIGHSDSLGLPERNLELSRFRAEELRQWLARSVENPIVILGFGQDVPLADNETPEGRQKNRRVEVFLGS